MTHPSRRIAMHHPAAALRAALLLGTALAGVAVLTAVPAAAQSEAGVRVRVGEHPGYSRVVYEFSQPVGFHVTREGNRVVVHFEGVGVLPGGAHLPRNVLAITGGVGQVSLELARGTGIRTLQLGGRVVIDVVDAGDPDRIGTTPLTTAMSRAPMHVAVVPAKLPPAAPAPLPAAMLVSAGTLPAPEMPAPPPTAPVPTGEPPLRGRSSRHSGDRTSRNGRSRTLPAAPTTLAATQAPPRPVAAPAPAVVAPADAAGVTPAPRLPVSVDTLPVTPPPGTPPVGTPPAATPPAATPAAAAAPAADAPAATPGVPPRPAPPVVDGASHAMTLPFAATTGAAAFSRDDTAFAVFDERRAIDLSAMQGDPVLGGATIQLLDAATVLRVKLPPGDELRLSRVPAGWTVAAVATPAAPAPIAPEPRGTAIFLAAPQPSQVVTVPDLETGWNLLVGTQHQPGQGLIVQRATPAYVLAQSWQGVVVEPRSDRLDLRIVAGGFLLESPGQDLVVPSVQPDAQVAANAAALTRQYDLPNLSDAALQTRLQVSLVHAAELPPLGRFKARKDLAQAMIALGLGVEAQSVLKLAAADDPQHQEDPDLIGLSGIAGVLAGRDDEAAALDDARLPATDELTLWRAVRAAQRPDGAATAAPAFAATLPLLLAYPKPLRDRLLPLAAEAMAQGGAPQAAALLLAALTPPPEPPKPAPSKPEASKAEAAKAEAPAGEPAKDAKLAAVKPAAPPEPPPEFDFTRALLAQHDGNTDVALALYDRVAVSPDQRRSALAAQAAVELKLATGRIDAAAAADALTHQFLGWRGPGHELALRLRAADLYADADRWRPAIDLLRETAAQFPDDQATIRKHQTQTFIAMLKDATSGQPGSGVSSLELVSLAEENPDLIPPGPDGDTLAALLADRLVALDLPKRAIPALDRLMRAAPAGNARAGIGARLARLRVDEGDGAGALATLDASAEAPADGAIDPDLVERRTLVSARAMAAQGDTPRAVAALSGLTSADAADLRATLLASAKDWHGAEAALTELVAKVIPPQGVLTDAQQSLVIRLAGAAAQAGDEPALRDLGQRLGPRMQNQKLGQMLRLLTGGPVGGMLEMKQVAQDIALARSLPASLTALGNP